jgi:diguanylate cyclase (GGDEF)-like protein
MGVPTRQASEERAAPRRGVREQALEVTLHCFVDSVGADTGAIIVRDPGGTKMLSHWAAEDQRLTISWTSETLLGRAFGSGDALIEQRPNGSNGGSSAIAVAAPFEYGVGYAGVVYGGFSQSLDLDHGRLTQTADSYARLAGLCLDPSPALAATLCAPSVDALTGCLSHPGLIEASKDEVARSRRRRHRLSCCFLGLDGFNRVNDERGHLEGNQVLSAVGDALRQTARRYDVVARFGGDEFVVVLPETSGRSAHAIAHRLRVAALKAILATTPVEVDVSVGIAEWDREASSAELLDGANIAMREAKRSGTAKVVAASGERGDRIAELTKNFARPWRDGRRRPR